MALIDITDRMNARRRHRLPQDEGLPASRRRPRAQGAPEVKIDRKIIEALDATGIPYPIVGGKKHSHVRVGGRLAAILPHGTSSGGPNTIKNCIAGIRRAARGDGQ